MKNKLGLIHYKKKCALPHSIKMAFCHCLYIGVLSDVIFMSRGEHTPLTHAIRQRIRRLRNENGLTQAQLCELAGIASDSVNRIESGRRVPTIDTLEKLARAYDMSLSTLISTDEPPKQAYPPSLMRIIYILLGHTPQVHEACEKLLTSALKGFLDTDIAKEVLKDTQRAAKKKKPTKKR